jgi:large subunit ribosomal protein L21
VYAVIEDRGTQIKVAEGDVIDIDVLSNGEKQPKTLTFDRVLLVGEKVGMPYVQGASVKADVVEAVQGEKLHVLMYKRRKGQRRKIGHRQNYLRVKITSITG